MDRKLRIAFSAACGMVCLLLVALWVRSYQNPNGPYPSHSWRNVAWSSQSGRVVFWTPVFVDDLYYRNLLGLNSSGPVPAPPTWTNHELHLAGIDLTWSSWRSWSLAVRYWFLTMIPSAIAVAPWIKWSRRFSLRTLLVGMTLAAIGLGLVAYAMS
jgi:hypothetical protein